MEAKLKLDLSDVHNLLVMLNNGAAYHRMEAIETRNTIDCIQHIMHADTFEKLLEQITIKVKRIERKQAYSISITLSNSECYSIVNGTLPTMSNSHNDIVKYFIIDAIRKASFQTIAFYSTQSPSEQILLS